jgi:DNA replication protein DnaC
MTKTDLLLDEHLRVLRLPGMLATYRRIADDDASKISYLKQLASVEIDKRHENGIRARITAAHFPVIKTMESFDFAVQPRLPKQKILAMMNGDMVAEKRNVILIGPTGVGKTHILTALGLSVCTAGYRVLFCTASEICMNLIAAKKDDTLKAKLAYYDRFDLLLIDELGYVPFPREATDLLFQVISARYERSSIALTTNLAFPDWTQIFPDAMAASAVIDRLVHHGTIIEFTGESHRLRARQAEGKRTALTKTAPGCSV